MAAGFLGNGGWGMGLFDKYKWHRISGEHLFSGGDGAASEAGLAARRLDPVWDRRVGDSPTMAGSSREMPMVRLPGLHSLQAPMAMTLCRLDCRRLNFLRNHYFGGSGLVARRC